jgi:hypothetical protein
VRGEGQHAPAEVGNRSGRIDRPEIGQQHLRPLQRARVGRLQPAEARDIDDPAGFQCEHDLGEIEPLHLRQFLRGPVVMFALRPQPQAESRRSPARPARPLLRARPADALDEQSIDAPMRIESRHPRQPRIHDDAHPVDRE